MRQRVSLGRIIVGIALGALGGFASPTTVVWHAPPIAGALPAAAATCQGINPTEQDGYSNAFNSTNVGGIQASITTNTTALRIDCSDDAYTVAIQAPNGNCGGPGNVGISQVGWIKSTTGSFTMVDYHATLAGGTGCGIQDYPVSNLTGTHTYRAASGQYLCGVYTFFYYLDNTLEDTVCSDWAVGNQIAAFGERLGSTNQMGAIGFWWTEYCTGLGCTPATAPGAPPWPAQIRCGLNQSGYCGYNGHIGWNGIAASQQSWPNFNVCDNSLSSSQC